MAEPRTRPTGASVSGFIDGVESERKREDSRMLVAMMERLTGEKAVMWGPSIIGFGTYTNPTKPPADWPMIGFSPRKASLTLYLAADAEGYDALIARLGKHSTSKACLYIKKLADIDLDVLEEMVSKSVAHMRANYPTQ